MNAAGGTNLGTEDKSGDTSCLTALAAASGEASRHTDGEDSDDESTGYFTPDSTNKSADSNDNIAESLKLDNTRMSHPVAV